ncbi:hypothetical protein [Actinomadura sp. NBRC 104425]|uniref:hypothetical protein n=1 Tax=Actinomadura sp. NBRC 104425 TaxID=3032204 RepID=UPI002552E0EB|nr:hypothetical protein [Actinomadura sp. NBRC 104425]
MAEVVDDDLYSGVGGEVFEQWPALRNVTLLAAVDGLLHGPLAARRLAVTGAPRTGRLLSRHRRQRPALGYRTRAGRDHRRLPRHRPRRLGALPPRRPAEDDVLGRADHPHVFGSAHEPPVVG